MTQTKVAVITGGSRGIGLAIASALIKRNFNVVIGDLLDQEGQAAVDAFNKSAKKTVAAYKHTDVTKYKDLLGLFELAENTFGGVDIAILNAGTTKGFNIFTEPMDDEADMFIHQVNVGGVTKGNKVALKFMQKRGGGTIINTASMAGIGAMSGLDNYVATKHAVVGWTRSLAYLNTACNVRVNAICPYWVDTELIRSDGISNPFGEFINKCPKTPMSVVVDAALQCIDDTELAGTTLLCLPDGVHQEDAASPHPSILNEEMIQALPEVEKYLAQTVRQAIAKL
ncbi:15-hydroxyprostaglandin dehydrogenase [Lichtheimia corymbifera JMRC:FSU:9682]|uniref:15-hydroxyprostaglandin dehydrogenase n=1 Tax=Lichtheimia corymbifera JMRC:FSU:9682 TaxID=1263082 RepID=A0A068RII7_9FUNG|nr:15-hydroxyprostaglandin dehydrogenase [Lichtheimia corymbifera JMRC:FSU:9682]